MRPRAGRHEWCRVAACVAVAFATLVRVTSAASLGVTCPIVGNSGIEGLEQISQMPYTLLFDHMGKCVFHGSALDVGPAATAFRGDAIGTDAAKLVVEWKKDPAFQGALKCGQQLAKLESLRTAVLGVSRVVTPDLAAAVPPDVKKQMMAIADGVQQVAPGSKMAERAAEIAAEFGLNGAGVP